MSQTQRKQRNVENCKIISLLWLIAKCEGLFPPWKDGILLSE